jgi:hypothetical protein
MPVELFSNPAFPRALVIGAFGGAGLVLTVFYSTRGPLIYLSYTALAVALTFLLARYPALSFTVRFASTLAAFLLASMCAYVAVGIHSADARRRLVRSGRLPESALRYKTSVFGHAWRAAFLIAIGSIVGAGVAFVSA